MAKVTKKSGHAPKLGTCKRLDYTTGDYRRTRLYD